MDEIKKAKELNKIAEERNKTDKKVDFYQEQVIRDIKTGRDPFNSKLKLKYEIKHCEELDKKFNRIKLM